MPVTTHHANYEARVEDWSRVRDAIVGESAVKAARETYLPRPPGMRQATHVVLDGGKRTGDDRYDFYLGFAEFPEIIGPTIDGLQGLIHEKPAEVVLPSQLDYLIKDATPDGEGIDILWERITREVIAAGRINLLHDVGADDLVRFCSYSAESMINWRLSPKREGSEPQLVVLREEVEEEGDDGFEVKPVIIYRELRLLDGLYAVRRWVEGEKGEMLLVVTEDTNEMVGSSLPCLDGTSYRSRSMSSTPRARASPMGPSRSCRWCEGHFQSTERQRTIIGSYM